MTAPAVPVLRVIDSRNGTTAAATVSGADAGTTNYIYGRLVAATGAAALLATISANGSATLTPGAKGEYRCYVVSSKDGETSIGIGSDFWISPANALRAALRDGPARGVLELAKQLGLQVDFENPGSATVTLWAIDKTAQDDVGLHGGATGVRRATLIVPRQSGWPPTQVEIGASVVIPSGSSTATDRFGVENLTSVNDSIGIKSVFRLELTRDDTDPRLGG